MGLEGVAAALDADGLARLEAGRLLLAQLQVADEATDRRERAAQAALGHWNPAEDGPGEMLNLISGLLNGSLFSSPLFDVSDVAAKLDQESARRVLFAAAAWLASGTAGYFSLAERIAYELSGRDLAMTPTDLRLLAVAQGPFDLLLDCVERLLSDRIPGATELAEAVAAQAGWWKVKSVSRYAHRVDYEPQVALLRDRALALAGYPPPPRFEGPRTGSPAPPGCWPTASSRPRAGPPTAGSRSAAGGSKPWPIQARCCTVCSACSPPRHRSAS